MITDAEKLKNFRNKYKITQQALAAKLNVKQAVISRIEQGERNASANLKLAFLKEYGLDWDSQIIANKEDTSTQFEKETNIVKIPFYSAKAAAGFGISVPDYPEKDVMYFDKRWLKNVVGINPENASIIQAKGDSMDSGLNKVGDIHNGDLLMVDHSLIEPMNNQIYVVMLGDTKNLVVKRITKNWDGLMLLRSNNPTYIDIIPPNDTTIIGKVVWNGSKENV